MMSQHRRGSGWWAARLLAGGTVMAGLVIMAVPMVAQPQRSAMIPEQPRLPISRVPEMTEPNFIIPIQDERPRPAPMPPVEKMLKMTEPNNIRPVQDERPRPMALPPVDKMPKGGAAELPPARPVLPFGPDKVRLPQLGSDPGPLGATPKPTEEDLKDFNQFVEDVIDPRHVLDMIQGRPRLILLKETPSQIQVADDSILGYNLLTPKQFTILGRQVGTTVMTLWFPDPKDKTKDKILSYLVRVLPDPDIKKRIELIYRALEKEINKVFPDSRITLTLVGDKVVASGEAKDIAEATQILRIIRANQPDAQRLPINNINIELRPSDLTSGAGTPGLDSYLTAGGPNVINNIRIPGEQQVMLRVTVAEVSRTAARTIGLNFNIINNRGQTVFGQQTGGISITGNVTTQNLGSNLTGGVVANIPILLDNGQIPIAINALKTLNYAKSLAEPNLVAINGQTASFRSGGSFPVPVLAAGGNNGFNGNNGGGNLQGVQFVPYGVQLNFTPIITDRDRIRLQVQADVSTRDVGTGATVGNTAIPGLNSRNFNTTVEMREGQTLAVAGLIQSNMASESNRVPFFGDIPILNRFTGIDRIQSGESELVILITPELVHPLEKKEVSKLPGADLFEPSDLEFYFLGRLEGRRTMEYRSPIRNDIHRMIQYKHCEQNYIFGPVGHTDDPNYPLIP
ncbi:MAG: pilus assembly protein N-terminal domain-containing protein [Planctomycetes bacterium]|nr:pilus assembly protein N-terminal domain-containing protein [Planctomycetota bacterium]